MKRLLKILFILTGLVCMQAQGKQANIVLFFADDLGFNDLGFRNSLFETPNIDQLSKESMSFERAYVATPTCSPSRASILTGKQPVRIQMVRHITHGNPTTLRNEEQYNIWESDPAQMPSINWLPLEEVTYAERLKDLGYYNMFIGKWHLGHEEYHPVNQGFDQQFGTGNHGHPNSYYPPYFKQVSPLDNEKVEEGKYLTDLLTDKAVNFITTFDKKQPFMLSLWYYNVHGPHEGPKELIEKYISKGMEKRYANYGAMVEAMDKSVGRVRRAIKEKGIEDNTVIIFTSDQGGYFTNYPLRGKKNGGNTLGEGGARVPFIIYYPGVTKPFRCEVPVQTLDIYSTLIEIASGKEQCDLNVDGVSLVPLLKGNDIPQRELYFFRSYEDQYAAVIDGDWKLIKYHSNIYQLYNLAKDISEVNNLIYIEEKKAQELKTKLVEWEEDAVPKYK